jgi:hypothetical protein
MSSPPTYKNREQVDSACEALLTVVRPGDVVNQVGEHKWWQFWLAFTHDGIQRHQRKLFGRESNWRDTHTMLYFDEHNTFSVELPRATMKPLREYCLSNLTIYRLRLSQLTPEFGDCLREAAAEMVGEGYDIGQLLDIAINNILGYEHQRRLRLFDFGRKKKVCSVGVRVAFESLYQKKIKMENSRPGKWLFYELNPEKWQEREIQKYKGTDVEATSPAHFANSDYFSSEFELIGRFEGGEQIYPR